MNERQAKKMDEMRGVCSFKYNGKTIFVKANVEDVARSLSKYRNASQWQQNVVDQEVELTEQCFFVFQFNGHTWTNIIARNPYIKIQEIKQLSKEALRKRGQEVFSSHLNIEDASFLSMDLKTPVIYYGVSDTACALGYRVYENGELLEKLETGEGYEILEWESSIHEFSLEKIEGKVEEWVEQLFCKYDVLEPGIHFKRWVGYVMHKPGDKVTTRDSESNLERVDFITL